MSPEDVQARIQRSIAEPRVPPYAGSPSDFEIGRELSFLVKDFIKDNDHESAQSVIDVMREMGYNTKNIEDELAGRKPGYVDKENSDHNNELLTDKQRHERNQSIKEGLEIARSVGSKDYIPGGTYKVVDGEIQRVGDAHELTRYHGTLVPRGTIIEEFDLSLGNMDSVDRPSISVTPALYSTSNAMDALSYVMHADDSNWTDPNNDAQLYTFKISPRTVIDLGDCKDDALANEAIRMGFDVIECPDFWEQPETIVFDPDLVMVSRIHLADLPSDNSSSWTREDDEQINKLKEQGYLSDPIYKDGIRDENAIRTFLENRSNMQWNKEKLDAYDHNNYKIDTYDIPLPNVDVAREVYHEMKRLRKDQRYTEAKPIADTLRRKGYLTRMGYFRSSDLVPINDYPGRELEYGDEYDEKILGVMEAVADYRRDDPKFRDKLDAKTKKSSEYHGAPPQQLGYRPRSGRGQLR